MKEWGASVRCGTAFGQSVSVMRDDHMGYGKVGDASKSDHLSWHLQDHEFSRSQGENRKQGETNDEASQGSKVASSKDHQPVPSTDCVAQVSQADLNPARNTEDASHASFRQGLSSKYGNSRRIEAARWWAGPTRGYATVGWGSLTDEPAFLLFTPGWSW